MIQRCEDLKPYGTESKGISLEPVTPLDRALKLSGYQFSHCKVRRLIVPKHLSFLLAGTFLTLMFEELSFFCSLLHIPIIYVVPGDLENRACFSSNIYHLVRINK